MKDMFGSDPCQSILGKLWWWEWWWDRRKWIWGKKSLKWNLKPIMIESNIESLRVCSGEQRLSLLLSLLGAGLLWCSLLACSFLGWSLGLRGSLGWGSDGRGGSWGCGLWCSLLDGLALVGLSNGLSFVYSLGCYSCYKELISFCSSDRSRSQYGIPLQLKSEIEMGESPSTSLKERTFKQSFRTLDPPAQ